MSKRSKEGIRLSRRDLFKVGAAAGAAAVTGGLTAKVAHATEARARGRAKGKGKDRELVLVNGRIHTMDDRNRVVSSVTIRNGRFAEVGHADRGSDARVIDLRGATVVPGLVESHTHFVSLCNRPGYHVAQWELATNVAEVLAILKARRARGDVPPGAFITAMGAGTPNIWFERRQPTLAELDTAVPDRPVFLYFGGGGPARVNTLGKQFFEGLTNPTVTVQADGAILGGNPSQANAALYHLRIRQTFEDKKRSALDAMAYTAQVGVTTNLDQTLVAVATGTLQPETLDPQPNHALFNLNHFRMYDAYLALHAEGNAFTRLQMNFLHNQGFIPALGPDIKDQLPELRERLKNQFQFFGDDMVRTGAIGEWAAPFATPANPDGYAVWLEAQRLVAKARWRNENSQAGVANPASPNDVDQVNIEQVVSTYEMMHQEAIAAGFPNGIKDLRWGVQHCDHATANQLQRLKALNCGVSTSGFRWTSAPRADGLPVGPLFPRLVASGIPLALHQDGVHITAHNPWFALHYATTGRNNITATDPQGQQINPGQQISRQQALRMYTVGAAWYCNREDDLGSIEKGKLADLVVLDRDYFRVSDADVRKIRPILTVVDGNVVHDTGALGRHKHDDDDDHRRR
jgi:predicted amidohydrolase YtcJ